MELRHLRYFVVAGREQNFIRAAKILSVAQPALSRQIQALEKELGVALFERLRRGVRLSPAGRAFLLDAERILAQVDQAGLNAQRIESGLLGALHIGFSEVAIAYPVVAEALHRYHHEHPDVDLRLSTLTSPEQIQQLNKEALDVGFLNADPRTHPQLDLELLESDSLMLALPKGHPLAGRASLRLEDLKECDFIAVSPKRYRVATDKILAACWAKGFAPRIVQEVNDALVQIRLISVGLGVGFVHATQRHVQIPNVVIKPVKDLGLEFDLFLARRRNDHSRLVQGFVETVRAVAVSMHGVRAPRPAAPAGTKARPLKAQRNLMK